MAKQSKQTKKTEAEVVEAAQRVSMAVAQRAIDKLHLAARGTTRKAKIRPDEAGVILGILADSITAQQDKRAVAEVVSAADDLLGTVHQRIADLRDEVGLWIDDPKARPAQVAGLRQIHDSIARTVTILTDAMAPAEGDQ